MKKQNKKLTTASGKPYFENEDSMTVGPRGPILLQDFYLHEKLAHLTVSAYRGGWHMPGEQERTEN